MLASSTGRGDRGRARWRRRLVCLVLLIGGAWVAVQCGGPGGGGSGAFDVVSFSVSRQSPRVFLNDPIEIVFSQAVDPQTVLTGIYIYRAQSAGSQRAPGEWKVTGNRVVFTPRLPSDPGLTNGGFLSDTEYTICVPRPGDSCSVFLQNSPGLRSVRGRGLAATRTEGFLTVKVQGGQGAFRPERPRARPEVEAVTVADAAGVVQRVNPIVNLRPGEVWHAGLLTTVRATPPTTLVPGTRRMVPDYEYVARRLTKVVTSPIDLARDVVSKRPLVVNLPAPSPPLQTDELRDAGGVLKIRDSSSPPVEGAWAVASNTTTQVVTLAGSGPDLGTLEFKTPPLVAEVSQGITRQVAPGDAMAPTEIRIAFGEALNPRSVAAGNFALYGVRERQGALEYAVVPLASTLQGAARQGLTHEVIDRKSVVTLRAKASLPQSRRGDPATVVVLMNTAQPSNVVGPATKKTGLRDLNDFPLAYPKRTGWVLALDAAENVTTVAHLRELRYRSTQAPPADVEIAWGFQTRADVRVLDAIVETFSDTSGRASDCETTAAWTLPGQAGLFGTYGYGGSAADGDRTIQGAVTFDADARTPGPDGVVEWNFNRLHITPTGVLTLKGQYPIRLNALGDLTVEGLIDASGRNGQNAPPGAAAQVGRLPGGRGGPGGGAGGDSNVKPNDPIGALPMELRGRAGSPAARRCGEPNRSANRPITVVEKNCGGGTGGNRGKPVGSVFRDGCSGNGGGHATDGKQTDYRCGEAGAYGRDFGVAWVFPTGANEVTAPTGGTGGGAGGNAAASLTNPDPKADVVAGAGGGAGGGVELVAAGKLVVKGAAEIRADGASGGAGWSTVVRGTTVQAGYGAGGAGGDIWLSGTSVTVESGAKLRARGGTGNPTPPNPSRSGDGGDGYIIIRDRGGAPAVATGAKIDPPFEATRRSFDPLANGKSVAYSRFYDSGKANPYWAFDSNDPRTGEARQGRDLVWLNPPGPGQSVTFMFQGAPDENGRPHSDPTKWYPPGNTPQNPCAAWEPDITKLRGPANLRHLRFRITFDLGKRSKGQPPPNQVSIARLVIRFSAPRSGP